MIKLETAHIEEVRGIRKLDIDFRKGTFAISGPNGSGKSGVMDAIEFGLTAYEVYCSVLEEELNALYEEVQEDFSTYYRAINGDDESKFTAKLTPSEGKLDFDVNFYERGLFPPGAYHSEGHQDGMGVCLYLALMKRLFGDSFTIALLDDVVMSVD